MNKFPENTPLGKVKNTVLSGPWMVQLGKCLVLRFGSSHDPGARDRAPRQALCPVESVLEDSLPLPLLPTQ